MTIWLKNWWHRTRGDGHKLGCKVLGSESPRVAAGRGCHPWAEGTYIGVVVKEVLFYSSAVSYLNYAHLVLLHATPAFATSVPMVQAKQ